MATRRNFFVDEVKNDFKFEFISVDEKLDGILQEKFGSKILANLVRHDRSIESNLEALEDLQHLQQLPVQLKRPLPQQQKLNQQLENQVLLNQNFYLKQQQQQQHHLPLPQDYDEKEKREEQVIKNIYFIEALLVAQS